MRKTFLLTSILLLSASWTLAQYSSGSSATDQSTSGSQDTGAYSGSSTGTQPSTDEANQGVNPGSSDTMSQSEPSSDASATQSSGGRTSSSTSQTEGAMGQSMSSQQGETSSEMSSQTGTASGRRMTFEGCLSRDNGKFHLTDNMGNSYQLTGRTANLKAHVGHTISVTGRATTSGESQPGAMSGEQAGGEQTIRVSSFRHVSRSCKSSSGHMH